MSISKKNSISIIVERASVRTSDGAGGYTSTPIAISGSPFTGRKIRRKVNTNPTLIESRPGAAEISELVLVFPLTASLKEGDIATVGTRKYTIKTIRTYTRSIQADAEAIV